MTISRVNEQLWQALRASTTPRTVTEMLGMVEGSRRAIEQRVIYWNRAGLLVRTPGKPARYVMESPADQPASPPQFARDGTMLAANEDRTGPLWRAMRVLSKRGTFDVPALSMIAATTPAYADNYVNRLRRAGYLRLQTSHANWRGGAAAYRLVRDTGPKAPRIDVRPGQRFVIDPNSGDRIDISPGRLSLRSQPSLATADGGEG